MTKHAADRFQRLEAAALPAVYVAKHDPHEHVREQFQKAWEEAVGGSRAVGLYIGEIADLCTTYLDSPQWIVKHTAARAIADAVTTLTSADSRLSAETAARIWPTLEKALGGKTWEGKEVVLLAFARFVESGKEFWGGNARVAADVIQVCAGCLHSSASAEVPASAPVPPRGRCALERVGVRHRTWQCPDGGQPPQRGTPVC